MTTWTVSNRATGEVVYAYTSDEAVDWPDMGFALFNHIAAVEVTPSPIPRRLSKLDYMQRFTEAEMAGIYSAAKSSISLEVWLAKFNATTPDPDGTSVDLDDPRTIGGLFAMESAGLLAAGRAAEITA
jgi:hypothetical protein